MTTNQAYEEIFARIVSDEIARMERLITFRDLQNGDRFKFFADGSVLMKASHRTYDCPQWRQFGNQVDDMDQAVITLPDGFYSEDDPPWHTECGDCAPALAVPVPPPAAPDGVPSTCQPNEQSGNQEPHP